MEMSINVYFKRAASTLTVMGWLMSASSAFALDLDWSGQFRADLNMIKNYTLDSGSNAGLSDPARATAAGNGGYYFQPSGSTDSSFRTLFMRVRPKLVVNDNIYIKSEWWLGDPVYGFYGSTAPYSADQTTYYSTFNRGAMISAQRFWGEFISDFGTIQVGRAPLHWGLGIVWNNGDGIWDRYVSTGDVIRLVAKFGSFSFIPSYISYNLGNSIGGSCATVGATGCTAPGTGTGSLLDYSLALKYENLDEDFEAGVNFIKRLGGASQTFYRGPNPNNAFPGMNYNTWDLYAKKKLGRFTFAAEAPITSGNIGGATYSTFAVATEVNWKVSDHWETALKAGRAPGQASSAGNNINSYKAYYFHPNYHLGLIMFNYQLYNFGGVSAQNNAGTSAAVLASPYDNPINNAYYLSWNGALHADKWTFNLGFVWAKAVETAVTGQNFFNIYQRSMSTATAVADQSSSLGWELDLGTQFQWDDSFVFRLDAGMWNPGDFFKFSNILNADNQTSTVFAAAAKVGVSF